MHFTTLFILKGVEITEDNHNEIFNMVENTFGDSYCYSCGETRPKYRYWCDWFQIGGRWSDHIVAKSGIKGERSWGNKDEKDQKDHYSIINIKDLKEPLDKYWVYSIATKSKLWEKGTKEFDELLEKVNNKQINGVIAFIDCHD